MNLVKIQVNSCVDCSDWELAPNTFTIKTFDLPSDPNSSASIVTQGVTILYNYSDVTLAGLNLNLIQITMI